jgi:hypothetical protein
MGFLLMRAPHCLALNLAIANLAAAGKDASA